MITEIDKEKLSDLIKSFHNLTGIKVAVFNNEFLEILAYPQQSSEFCNMIHSSRSSCNKCQESTERLCVECAKKKKVIIEKCHAGLTEVIVPLSDGVSVIGYIMFGQITNEKNRDKFLKEVAEKCEKYKLDEEEIKRTLSKILYYPDNQIEDASKILAALAGYIVFDKLVYSIEKNMVHNVTEYIINNLEKNLSIKELCDKFYLSKSGIYKITKDAMPNGITSFIRKQRMEKAAQMLRCTNKPAWEIA